MVLDMYGYIRVWKISHYFSNYSNIIICLEIYLTIDMYHNIYIIEYTRFRCSSHNLAINKFRPIHDRVDKESADHANHRRTEHNSVNM